MFPDISFITEEYRRLDALCDVDTSYIPIKTYKKASDIVAMCLFVQGTAIPSRWMFNLYRLQWLPEDDCLDVIRHEYAHAAAGLLFGAESFSDGGHGPLWRELCSIVDCRPYPYIYNFNQTEMLPRQKVKGAAGRCVECCRCGAVSQHQEDSRIIKILKAGLTSWNYTCPKCGGLRFRLVDTEEGGRTCEM